VIGRLTSGALIVTGVSAAVLGALLVARGVGFVFWVMVTLAAAGFIALTFLWLLGLLLDFGARPLGDRYLDWRAERREARWLRGHPVEAAELAERKRALLEWERGPDHADDVLEGRGRGRHA
jgi:hypothetical protein